MDTIIKKILKRNLSYLFFVNLLFVLPIILFLFLVFHVIDEVNHVNGTTYNFLEVLNYSLFSIPKILFQISNLVILIASALTISHIIYNKELHIYLTAGISVKRILLYLIKNSLFLSIILIILNDFLTPLSHKNGEIYKANLTGQKVLFNSDSDIWIKKDNKFIFIDKVNSNFYTKNVLVFEVNENNLEKQFSVESGLFEDQKLSLKNLNAVILRNDNNFYRPFYSKHDELNISFEGNDLKDLISSPATMSSFELISTIIGLKDNQMNSFNHSSELISRLRMPFYLTAMLFIALPLMISFSRNASLSKNLFLSIFIAIIFDFASKFLSATLQLSELDIIITNLIALSLVVSISYIIFSRNIEKI